MSCLICGSLEHATALCAKKTISLNLNSWEKPENLAVLVEFRLQNDLDLGPLYDKYGHARVLEIAAKLGALPETPRNVNSEQEKTPEPATPLAETARPLKRRGTPCAPPRPPKRERASPIRRGFRLDTARRQLSFHNEPEIIDRTLYLELKNKHTILTHEYNRLRELYRIETEHVKLLRQELAKYE